MPVTTIQEGMICSRVGAENKNTKEASLMENIEPRPKPTTFNLTQVETAQLIVDPSSIGEQSCRSLMRDDNSAACGQTPFVYIFVIQPNRRVLVMTQAGSIAPSRKTTRSMDAAMDLWKSLENSGWIRLSADFWYGGTGTKGEKLGIVSWATATKAQTVIGVEGKVCDLGYNFCILGTRAVPVSPTFHVRRRKIVSST